MTILSRVQTNPEIGTDNATYVAELVTRAKDFIVDECHLPIFPELLQGKAVSAASATEDNTGLDSNKISIAVNNGGWQELELTLANCDTGINTAAEMQTQIRAVDIDQYDEVTVAFSGTQYTITSGRYGEDSAINFAFE